MSTSNQFNPVVQQERPDEPRPTQHYKGKINGDSRTEVVQ